MSCTVIIGGGIIGCATAYYLLLNDEKHTVHLVDPAPVLFVNVASGKAGGFLAKNWFSRNVAQLGLLSFNLHAQLAEENDGRTKWGWSQSMTFSADSLGNEWDWLSNNNFRLDHKAAASETHNGSDPSWVSPSVKLQPMSESGTTAQVDPLRLSRFLLEECTSRPNFHLHNPAVVTNVDEKSVVRIEYDDHSKNAEIRCDNVIVTSGPWTTSVLTTLFPNQPRSAFPEISSLSGHSLVLRSKHWPQADTDDYPCHAIFLNDPGAGFSPEVFSRVGGDIYVAGLNDSGIRTPLPSEPTEPRPQSMKELIKIGQQLFRDSFDIVREGVCFRPVTADGNPFIGRVKLTRFDGPAVWVAAGHGPWGITLSLGTGMVLSQMVLGLPTSVHVGTLAPK